MNRKIIGGLLLALGFLAGSYVIVAQVATVDWTHYGACAAAMLVGLILVRSGGEDAAIAHERHEEDLGVLDESLAQLVEKIAAFEAIGPDLELLSLHHRIDDELMVDFNRFVDARESMIPRLGMQNYADVMSPFATGERLINRAWSASADGYVDEVRGCLKDALAELQQARTKLAEARG